ncbi:diguanylate cyclase (GGDEF)-like protein/PAS domain S-box-containing protein [Sphingomonas kaistensis]|uniref:Diguanylate cyclase (GGDEF)-like protein/PAS domain S-box-containing protein n=1 Tax=Sphingomonas kaistensis TaxID=298708 RepID=A0A7X5Y4U0_9SPHN|nr:EAL domain-containing protein [Sphingomonas kaistensis]NJC05202.1 diguanylate cyclase (GGDEF)-like protein/PAS domain S-box-containing protein [Sphingomonas kaistensis]
MVTSGLPPAIPDRFEQMLDQSATAAVCAGADGIILSWNRAAEALLGHSGDAAVGKPLTIIIPPAYRAAHEAGLARAVKYGASRMAGHAVEIVALHAEGHELPVDLSLSLWFEGGSPVFGALIRDVSDRRATMNRLQHLAHCDTLTTLPNRAALLARLEATIAQGPCSLLMLDLDGFKHVNDSLGHSAGDHLLVRVAQRLMEVSGGTDEFVARLGGDEFALLVSRCDDMFRIDQLATRIKQALSLPFEIGGQSVFIGTSIGIALAPHNGVCADTLLSRADLALYSAKSSGGGTRCFFMTSMQNRSEQRLRLSNELRQAFTAREFELWYQPQLSLPDHDLLGVEALLRWRHPRHGLLAPNAFLDVLSESPIAEEVGEWILDEACAAVARWKRQSLGIIRVGVNLFPAQLRTERLYDVVANAIARHQLEPAQLEVEITENTVLRFNEPSTAALRRLKQKGVGIAFDDFGTGFASLSMLQQFPLTRLKIDRSFIAEIHDRPGDAEIVRSLLCMANSFDLEVIAEGVETAEQEQVLRDIGCVAAQGFRYGRPMDAAAIAAFLRNLNEGGLAEAG